jgi:hypothetical protein
MFGLNVIETIFVAGFSSGFAAASLVWLFAIVRPNMRAFQRLRYDGFRPETPMPERPKTVPKPNFPNEGLA